jgi:hypothetical protein
VKGASYESLNLFVGFIVACAYRFHFAWNFCQRKQRGRRAAGFAPAGLGVSEGRKHYFPTAGSSAVIPLDGGILERQLAS